MRRSPIFLMVLPLAVVALPMLPGSPLLTGSQPANDTSPATQPGNAKATAIPKDADRSPVDFVFGPGERWLVTANQTSHSISLVDVATGKVIDEAVCGRRPSAIALAPDGKTLLVTGTYSGEVTFFQVDGKKLTRLGNLQLGFEPRGVAIAPDGKLAYIALTSGNSVAVVDVPGRKLVEKIAAGIWPRYLGLTPDGSRLAVGNNGDGGIGVIDTAARKKLFAEEFVGLNFGQLHVSNDGKYAYMPWIIYRHNPITATNIRRGWVIASRIARVRLDESARREAIALDPEGQAVSDPFGLALSPDEKWMVCSASGTHELLVYLMDDLPFQDYGGPGDHIDSRLLKNPKRFYRFNVGGRPMALHFNAAGDRIYVANYLLNAIQEVDWRNRKVVRTIDLGGPAQPSLARKGETIFYDGQRSLDQWYSCHSCHYEGHTNAVTMDTFNDGRFGNFKTVLSLRNIDKTGPWFWHGWQKDLNKGLHKSLTDTMLAAKPPSEDDVRSLRAFFETLETPANPYRQADGSLTEAARRGEKVFQSDKAGCARCHPAPLFTDGRVHDVGLSARTDVYQGYNPPSLLNVHDRIRLLHDGRASSLEEVLRKDHNPATVTGRGDLTDSQLQDLIAYLRSL